MANPPGKYWNWKIAYKRIIKLQKQTEEELRVERIRNATLRSENQSLHAEVERLAALVDDLQEEDKP